MTMWHWQGIGLIVIGLGLSALSLAAGQYWAVPFFLVGAGVPIGAMLASR